MHLRKLTCTEFDTEDPRYWSLQEVNLGLINLIVGKNATGKTRTINLIKTLGDLLAGNHKIVDSPSANLTAVFDQDGEELTYHLKIDDGEIYEEEFSKRNEKLLERRQSGEGQIFYEQENKYIKFQIPVSEIAITTRQDTLQHSFLKPLSTWGHGLRHYSFGGDMGRRTLAFVSTDGEGSVDPRESRQVVGVWAEGVQEFKEAFKQGIIEKMGQIGYDLESVDLALGVRHDHSTELIAQSEVKDSRLSAPPEPGDVIAAFAVKERDLPGPTLQFSMSQGMFRAFAILIHLQYAEMSGQPSCILIDDIGEGLDFDRATRLIKQIREQARRSNVQLIMATNDRFVMNHIPLEEWCVLKREQNIVKAYNYQTHPKKFENFKLTGLNNFDFLAMDFIDEPEDIFEQPSILTS